MDGKIAIMPGGGTGIGAATIRALAGRGAAVSITPRAATIDVLANTAHATSLRFAAMLDDVAGPS